MIWAAVTTIIHKDKAIWGYIKSLKEQYDTKIATCKKAHLKRSICTP